MYPLIGYNQNSIKESNLALVIRHILLHNNCTRTALVKSTGLKQATITKIVSQLIGWGLVAECESLQGGLGRNPVCLRVRSDQFVLIAARITRHYVQATLFDISGKMQGNEKLPISAKDGSEHAIDQLLSLIDKKKRASPFPVMAVGLALPGLFDSQRGRIDMMSGFPGWEGIDLANILNGNIDVPVFLDQDANCAAMAESWLGKYNDAKNLLYIVVERGIGAGLMLDGQIYRGERGFAGEIGHASINVFGPICECGNRGCLEGYCSTAALEQLYQELRFDANETHGKEDFYVTADEICQRVRAGNDRLATQAYEKAVSYLAFGISSVVNAFNPGTIIFGDKLTQGGPLFLQTVRKGLAQYLRPNILKELVIDISTFPDDAMIMGAGVLAFSELLSRPTAFFARGGEQGSSENTKA